METRKTWQQMRCFIIKGRILACRSILINIPKRWLMKKEEQVILTIITMLSKMAEEYDKNTEKLRP